MPAIISMKDIPEDGRPVDYRRVFDNTEPQRDIAGFTSQSMSQLFMGKAGKVTAGNVWYVSGDQLDLLGANRHGFVVTAMIAYSNECPLEIRPDDIWLSILAQFNTYANENGAAVRQKILKPGSKENLVLDCQTLDESSDYEIYADDVLRMFQREVLKLSFFEWAIPTFSTTSIDDQAAAAIMIMGQVTGYVNNPVRMGHGIPSVTLHGTKEDWKDILNRIEAFSDYGDEPARWFQLLRPVLQRIVNTIDDPVAKSTTDFWEKMIYQDDHFRGTDRYFGWISAFCFWNRNGNPPDYRRQTRRRADYHPLRLDGVEFHTINATTMVPGYASVPIIVKPKSNGGKYPAVIGAGLVGMAAKRLRSCNVIPVSEELRVDTLSPVSAWVVLEEKGFQTEDLVTDGLQHQMQGDFTTSTTFGLPEMCASQQPATLSVNTSQNTWQAGVNSNPFTRMPNQTSPTATFPHWPNTHEKAPDFFGSNTMASPFYLPFSPASNLTNSSSIGTGTPLGVTSFNTPAAVSPCTPFRQQTPSQESVDIPTHHPFQRPQFKQEPPEREPSPYVFSPTATLHPITGTELPMTHASIQHQMNVYYDRQTRQPGSNSQPSYMPLSSLAQTPAGRMPPSFGAFGVTPEQEAYYLQYLELQRQAAWRRG